jgi:hypothetical protein
MYAFIKILSYPVELIQSVLTNIYKEYSLIYTVFSKGGAVSAGMIWALMKWVILALFIFGTIMLICIDTVKRVMFAEREKNLATFFKDAIVAGITLFLYYTIVAMGLYVVFEVVLPIARIL